MALTKVTGQVIKNTTDVTVGVLTVTNTLAVGGTVSIGGTLTYEDVTNVDAVGLITARNGIVVGSGITLSKDGDGFFTGVTTATTLRTPTGIATHFTADKISLPDSTNGSLNIGVSSAFKINHNGTDSFITEVGGGDLYIQGSDIIIRDAGTLDKHIEMTQNGAVDIYHDNSKKFETTTAGVSVTGSATVSGDIKTTAATVNIKSGSSINTNSDTSAHGALHKNTNSGEFAVVSGGTGGSNFLTFYTSASAAPTKKMTIDSSGRVLIGTTTEGSTSADNLTIAATDGETVGITLRSDTDEGARIFFSDGTSGTAEYEGVIGYDHSSNHMYFSTNASEKLRIDSAGRVMIGQTSSVVPFMITATASNFGGESTTGVFGDATSYASGVGGGITLSGKYNSAGSQVGYAAIRGRKENGTDGNYDGALTFATRPNGSNMTEQARIDSGGRLGLGTNDPSSFNTYARDLVVARSSGDAGLTISAQDASSEYGSLHFSGGTTVRSYIDVQNGSSGRMFLMNKMDGYMAFGTNNTERYRIHNNGRQSWNNTTFPYGETFHFYNGLSGRASMSIYHGTDADEPGLIMRHGRAGANSGAYTGKYIQFRSSDGNERGSVTGNNGVTNFNTSSDYRLKENEVTISDAISKVKQLKPYTFNFKVTPDQKVDGFFAHEAQEVIPYAVMGEKDAEDMQQMDYGKLTPLLTAALQEAITEIESLKAEVAALKSS